MSRKYPENMLQTTPANIKDRSYKPPTYFDNVFVGKTGEQCRFRELYRFMGNVVVVPSEDNGKLASEPFAWEWFLN